MSQNPPVYSKELVIAANQFLANTMELLDQRNKLLSGFMDKPGRDIYKECGYERGEITLDQYHQMYDREGIAARVVNIWPDESWSVYPEVYQTENPNRKTSFEKKVEELEDTLSIWHYMHRADRLSGVGNYAVILFGFSGDRDLSKPVEGISEDDEPTAGGPAERELLYLRVFPQRYAKITEYNTDSGSKRNGFPTMYTLDMGEAGNVRQQLVHWTRIQHVADNCESSQIMGTPRLRPHYNRISDLIKQLGGSAEGFWNACSPKYSVESLPDTNADEIVVKKDDVLKEFYAFTNHLQKIVVMSGMTVKPLSPTLPDPTKYFQIQMEALATGIDVPLRIFMGSEAGHLASDQDKVKHNRGLGRRQTVYLNPFVVRPFFNRLQNARVLPRVKKYVSAWKDLNALSEKDQADVAMKRVQALLQYVTSGAEVACPPLEFWTEMMGLPISRAQEMVAAAAALKDHLTRELWGQPQPTLPDASGNISGRPSRNSTGK